MRGHPLTKEQREELLISYQNRGFRATKQLAISFGISPRYIARLARMNGIINNYSRGQIATIKVRKPAYTDKRWGWACERGGVVA
jgi:DNA-binding CsgD family transcriptional regulator